MTTVTISFDGAHLWGSATFRALYNDADKLLAPWTTPVVFISITLTISK